MSSLSPLLSQLLRAARKFLAQRRRNQQQRSKPPPPVDEPLSPGQDGPSATIEIDPHTIGPVRMTYCPSRDGEADPGEVVWTWVPYEENDGRGKDRPVLVVARESDETVLAVQLTSQEHHGFLPIGTGAWDSERRPSWVNISRVFRLCHDGMRRETVGLDENTYELVEAALQREYGWKLA